MGAPRPTVDDLYAVANDDEAAVLDALQHRAGFVWTCDGPHPGKHDPPRWTNAAPVACDVCGRYPPAVPADLDGWNAPQCLRWLAAHVFEANHYADRAADWAGEVARFAASEQIDPSTWEATATDLLRQKVAAVAWAQRKLA